MQNAQHTYESVVPRCPDDAKDPLNGQPATSFWTQSYTFTMDTWNTATSINNRNAMNTIMYATVQWPVAAVIAFRASTLLVGQQEQTAMNTIMYATVQWPVAAVIAFRASTLLVGQWKGHLKIPAP